MIQLTVEQLREYLCKVFGPTARLTGVGEIGSLEEQGMKDFGYGKPALLTFEVDGQERQAVLSMMKGDKYGHQNWWDRAGILMFQYDASPRMERHVLPLSLGYVSEDGSLHPVHRPREFFILNEKLQGHDYFLDLERIRKGGMRERDIELARRFARWLSRVHSKKLDDPDRYYRRVRNHLGASESIMGLIDEAYPHPYESFSEERFMALEKRLIDWRWKLKRYAHRLSAVHGDFHPWNVLVRDEGGKPDFSVLDRSRGEWGEPADDLATMAINYMLFGLYREPRLSGDFSTLYLAFFEEYLEQSKDREILEVMGPFFVMRGLVLASPEWYPSHPASIREGLFRFIENVLEDEAFLYADVNRYME